MVRKHLSRLLREPLAHFAVIGGLMFFVYGQLNELAPEPTTQILITPQRVAQLQNAYERIWMRRPADDETQSLIDDFVREEIYYREALAIGLDGDDTVIRLRLRQKMEFLLDTGADLLEPAPGELETYFAANEELYRKEPQLAFEQVFMGQSPSEDLINTSLDLLQSDPNADRAKFAERSVLPSRLGPANAGSVDGVFGEHFFQQVENFPEGQWHGPVRSGYGMHIVQVVQKTPAVAPPLETIRTEILRDWQAAKALEMRDQQYAKLRAKYTVEMTDAPDTTNGKP